MGAVRPDVGPQHALRGRTREAGERGSGVRRPRESPAVGECVSAGECGGARRCRPWPVRLPRRRRARQACRQRHGAERLRSVPAVQAGERGRAAPVGQGEQSAAVPFPVVQCG
ncbi:hypothetical protein STRTUCAR8_00803, partial [Streptomyces turgidiscabies Car8]